MLPESLVHDTEVVVELSFLFKRLLFLDSFQNVKSLLSLSLFFETDGQVSADFQKCWLTSWVSDLRSLFCPVGRNFHYFLVSFLIIVHCVLVFILLVVDYPDVEVGF